MSKNKKNLEEVEKPSTPIEESDEIIIGEPLIMRPQDLPLVVTLPASASKAQVHFAGVLNAYAYKNPKKWEKKKTALIAELKRLKDAPDPEPEPDGMGRISYKNKLIEN